MNRARLNENSHEIAKKKQYMYENIFHNLKNFRNLETINSIDSIVFHIDSLVFQYPYAH